jgi:uncharacterized protein (UPF0276 family)
VIGAADLSRKIGIGHRPEIASDLLLARTAVEFIEIVAETCYAQARARRECAALAEIWPVVPHGVKLSLGSADGIDEGRLGRLAALARELRAPLVSEHVSFTRGGEHEIGHLTQLPRSRAAIRVVARNVARARLRLPDVPLLLENVAFGFPWPRDEDEMDEPTFYQEIVRATGCPLLLDLGNLYANAVNEARDPIATLDRYPLERVAMLHVAGGVHENGFYFDTHAHCVPEPVFALVDHVLAQYPDVPILLERDGGFGPFVELEAEVARLRRSRPDRRGSIPAPEMPERPDPRDDAATAASIAPLAQLEVAAARILLGCSVAADASLAERIGAEAVDRARGILTRKRVDDALPLLGALARHGTVCRDVAERTMARVRRVPRGAGPADALRIARAAASIPDLRDAALRDALLLRARFRRIDASGSMGPRVAPFVATEVLPNGLRLDVWKSFGAFAPVRFRERKARSWKQDSPVFPRR